MYSSYTPMFVLIAVLHILSAWLLTLTGDSESYPDSTTQGWSTMDSSGMGSKSYS